MMLWHILKGKLEYNSRQLLKYVNMPPVRNSLSNEYNFIVLNIESTEKDKEVIKEKAKTLVENSKGKLTFLEVEELLVEIKYENLNYQQCIKKLFPDNYQEFPSSYELIGKIAHMNLRECFLPYKKIIGKLIIDV